MEQSQLQNELSMDTDTDASLIESKCIKSSYASEVSRRLYSDKETVDVFFTFEDTDERVSAHKCVLANASKVFRSMLYGPMAKGGDILLRGTPIDAFKIILQFCYLDEVTLKLDNITDVMKLLDQYGMVECLELCGRFWADNWNIEDICSAYSWAINLNMSEFREFCEWKISLYSDAVFKTNGFLSCSFDVFDRILSLDSLLIDESTVLGACLEWARKQCETNGKNPNEIENLHEYLKDGLYKIRYGSMTHAEFLTHMNEYNGLFIDAKDYENVMRLLCGSKDLNTDKFRTEPRKQIPSKWSSECDFLTKLLSPRRESNEKRPYTVLRTNQSILLSGIQMVNCSLVQFHNISGVSLPTDIDPTSIELKITEQQSNNDNNGVPLNLIYTNRITCSSSIEPPYFDLNPNYIRLKPSVEYRFQFYFEPADGRTGTTTLSYEGYELEKEIQLNRNVIVHVDAPDGKSLIKKSAA